LAAATFRVGSSFDPACDFNSLANAIAAAAANGPGMDEIRLARNLSVNAVSLTITDQNLEIAGGYANCGATADATPSNIPGSTAAAGVSLITIQGNATENWQLTLRNLQLIGNRGDDSARGGALRIAGYTVELIDSAILSNQAGRGGGAYLEGPGTRLLLDGARSTILSNIATIAGGGVYCTDRGRIEILTGAIDRNQVMGTSPLDPSDVEVGNGGGAALLGGCELTLRDGDASGGLRGITQNTARRDGGGVFLSGGSVLRGIGDAQRPARFQFNRAPAGRGGAIFAFDPAGASASSRVELSNTQFERNDAGEGGAVALVGAILTMGRTLAGRDCHDPTRCSQFRTNGFGGIPTATRGAVVSLRGASATIDASYIEQQSGPELASLFELADGSLLTLRNSFVLNNFVRRTAVVSGAGSTVELDQVTSSGNTGAASAGSRLVLLAAGSSDNVVRLQSSVVDDVFERLVEIDPAAGTGNTVSGDCLLLRSSSGTLPFPGMLSRYEAVALSSDVRFLSSGSSGSFTLQASSPAIDFCDGRPSSPSADAFGNPRPRDLATVADLHGSYDLGADEFSDLVFGDGYD
jgi:hypothetical protein